MSYKILKYSKRKVHYGFNSRARKRHPVIRLSGNYLARHGFNIGSLVEVEIEPYRIIIRSLEKPNDLYSICDNTITKVQPTRKAVMNDKEGVQAPS